jgi:polysaccharide deacetylase family protein (PEP-CTERM system associated)
MKITNFLTIDVEDYFQVSAFEAVSPPESWDDRELRVERNTEKILEILNEAGVKATFFVLGWVADRCPRLVKKIAAEGHEVASHGYWHRRVNTQDRKKFREDIRKSKIILEDLSGQKVFGYRAPSYSISRETFWAFDELYEAGYRYDSSIFPIHHDFYGMSDWPRFAGKAIKAADGSWRPAEKADDGQPSLDEVPITTLQLGEKRIPIAGGGYFRLFPYAITKWGLSRINRMEKKPFVFYLHPWELDPQQPRMEGAGVKSQVRHYLNLGKTEKRFRKLLMDFSLAPLMQSIPLEAQGFKVFHGAQDGGVKPAAFLWTR